MDEFTALFSRKDMTFEEVETLLRYLTYLRSNKGKTL